MWHDFSRLGWIVYDVWSVSIVACGGSGVPLSMVEVTLLFQKVAAISFLRVQVSSRLINHILFIYFVFPY